MTGFVCSPEALNPRMLSAHQYALVAAERIDQLAQHIARLPTATGLLADSAALLPALVHLASLAPATLSRLQQSLEDDLQEGRVPVFCTLLGSDAAPQTVAAHLSSVQVIASTAGERAWLRIHDPRVWLQLARVLDPRQVGRLCGPVARWTSCFHGQWTTHAAQPDGLARPLTLDEESWAAVGRIGAVNRVLARLRITDRSDAERCSPAIDALILRAQRLHGLQRTDDWVEYARLGMTVHPRFDEHEDVVRAIGQALDGSSAELDFMETLMSIDPKTWQGIARELSASEAREER